jgi:hypothetical protein
MHTTRRNVVARRAGSASNRPAGREERREVEGQCVCGGGGGGGGGLAGAGDSQGEEEQLREGWREG